MNDMTLNLADAATVQRLADALALQRAAYLAQPVPSFEQRRTDLRTLQRFVREHKEALIDAIRADYGHRSRHE
ncbi:MAG TPA: coniferyl-aldehyde dehydrogenase, partial [Rubrivivax sp.]|nr:coniferyl-aldehyde dehydrogenase [Rubrivivax sp.]